MDDVRAKSCQGNYRSGLLRRGDGNISVRLCTRQGRHGRGVSRASGSTEKEADITPQTMDITIRDKSGSHQYHGVRSDEASWNRAVLDLSNLQITRMSSVLVTLNDSSAIVQHGSESMNGYDTTKFSIDTANASSSDRRKFETLFGNGSFEKGTVWAPPDGCAVKLVLDEAVQVGGSLNKAHYEINRIKK
jgi:hypothetical protein